LRYRVDPVHVVAVGTLLVKVPRTSTVTPLCATNAFALVKFHAPVDVALEVSVHPPEALLKVTVAKVLVAVETVRPVAVELKSTVPPFDCQEPPLVVKLPPTVNVPEGKVVVPFKNCTVPLAVRFVSVSENEPPAPSIVSANRFELFVRMVSLVLEVKRTEPPFAAIVPPTFTSDLPMVSWVEGNVSVPLRSRTVPEVVALDSVHDTPPAPFWVRLYSG
jgi:hypothetical protein